MNKKTTIFILIFVLMILIGLFVYLLLNKPEEILVNAELPQEENIVTQEKTISELQIYDIEEGYVTVPYNNNATKHQYNWDNLSITKNGYYTYSDDIYESKIGIDVSKFQGDIDWKKVKKSGIEFAIIRLGFRGYGDEGNIVLDTKFEENAIDAKKENIYIGIYFFSQAMTENEAIEEARYVLENIKDKNVTYPICFDLEKIKYDTARTDNLTSEQITNIAIAFCEEIKNSGYTPIIYGNSKTFTTRMQLEKLNNYQKWYADYLETPLYPYDFSLWQYTETGKVNGISGNVDINIQFIKK